MVIVTTIITIIAIVIVARANAAGSNPSPQGADSRSQDQNRDRGRFAGLTLLQSHLVDRPPPFCPDHCQYDPRIQMWTEPLICIMQSLLITRSLPCIFHPIGQLSEPLEFARNRGMFTNQTKPTSHPQCIHAHSFENGKEPVQDDSLWLKQTRSPPSAPERPQAAKSSSTQMQRLTIEK